MPTVKSYEDYMRDVLKVTEPEKQSVYQKQKNRIDYQKYASNYLAEQNKNQQIAELERNKQKSLSESAIAKERARQYVDAVNKHLGISGTGYGESKAIDLYSQEAQRNAEINNTYDSAKNDALNVYQNAVIQNELTASDKLGEVEVYENEAYEVKRQNAIAKLQEIADNPDVSKEEFDKYYNEYAKYLGEDDTILKNDLEDKKTAFMFEEQEKTKYDDYNSVAFGENDAGENPDWYIQGLGTGRTNDDIDITIGATSRNRSEEFDLLCGDKVTDTQKVFALNKLATGNENLYPDIEGKSNSGASPQQLVVYKGDMYVYTSKGWRIVKDDNKEGEAKRAVEVYMNYINNN